MDYRSTAVLLALCCLAVPALGRADVASDLAACEARFAAHPDVEESSICFFDLAQKQNLWAEAAGAMERLLARDPDNGWVTLYLGHLRWRELDRAGELYHRAAELFAARSEARGEYLARASLHRILLNLGQVEEAGKNVERAIAVAAASGDPGLVARGQVLQARHLLFTGEDLARAYLLLRRAESALFPDGDYPAQRDCLTSIGNVSLDLGRTAESRAHFRRLAELSVRRDDRFAEATAHYGIVRSLIEEMAEVPREGGREELLDAAHRALAAAASSGQVEIEGKASLVIGQLTDGAAALAHLDRCRAAAAGLRERSYCLDALARRLAAERPEAAQAAIDEALDLARQAEDPWAMAFAWRERMRVSWAAGPLDRAIADSRSALEAIEALRDQQGGSEGQAGLFSTWSDDYHWLSGRLLEAFTAGQAPEGLGIAFGVTERMRARALIDALEAASAAPAATEPARGLQARRAAVLEGISRVQRRLLTPGLPRDEWERAQRELEGLELEEADLTDRIARANPAFAALRRPDFATLERVQASLAADEALLSFQVAPWQDWTGDAGGGSWLVVATRATARAYRLPDRVALRPAIALFTGLFEARDGSEVGPAVRLYGKLLAAAVADLPAGVRRLVLVPDDALYQLPFAALREARDAAPLGARYEVSVVPSATLWLRWSGSRPSPSAAPVLALADPPTPGGEAAAPAAPIAPVTERAVAFSTDLRLEALPHARREGRAVVRYLGGRSSLRLGEKASEEFVKSNDLTRFGILHFATHAITDEENPDRSGVLLAPGTAADDGLLQIREIVDLGMGGRIVVLSSCRSASGAVLRGEGVMSLARAFFQAGAHAVVGSLWPLRDDEAAALFDHLYSHLGEGESVAAALSAAQRDMIAAGAPAAAWAGVVVLGDGGVVPLPGGKRGLSRAWQLVAAGGGLLALLGLFAWLRRRTAYGATPLEDGPAAPTARS